MKAQNRRPGVRLPGSLPVFFGGVTLDVPRPGAWITGQQLVDDAGHPVALPS